MDHVYSFKNLLECIPVYEKVVVLLFLNKNDGNFFREYGFLKNDIIRLNLELKSILIEQNEENLNYVKNQEESKIEKILNT